MTFARLLGYTRGAFYSQFDSLDELFFTLYDERAQIIAQQVTHAMLGESDASDTRRQSNVSRRLCFSTATGS